MVVGFADRHRSWWRLLVGVILLVIAAGTMVGSAAPGSTFEAKVVGVVDGDSLEVLRGQETIRVRLEGIDCPEMHPSQPYCGRAKQFTSKMAFGKTVQVRVVTTDRYGRKVSRVVVDGRDMNTELLRAGFAWHYKHFSQEPQLAQLEARARAQRRGLWADPNPIPPWEWRRFHRS